MKIKIFLGLFLLLASDMVRAAAPRVSTRQRIEIAQMLTRIGQREVYKMKVKVKSISASKKQVTIYTSIDMSYYPFREDNTRAIYDSVRSVLGPNFRKASIRIITDRHEISELIPLAFRTQKTAVKSKKKNKNEPILFTNPSERPLIKRLSSISQPELGLSGRHIALWQSHGRYFDQVRNKWRWQRSCLWETCEDLYTQSYVLPYLVPMLENAGACVLLPRERDTQLHEMIADNDQSDSYKEQGIWQNGDAGFAHRYEIYRTGDNPFRHGTTRKTVSVRSDAQNVASWSVDFPEKGEYAVYVSYATTPESADDAHYTVHHAGGESRFEVNQTMGGGTWIYLGKFPFDEGRHEVVTLSNQSREAGRIVSADAVKVGGGYGNIVRVTNPSLYHEAKEFDLKHGSKDPETQLEFLEETSGYPRFCEGARYWLQWAGFGEEVYAPKEHLDDYKEDYMSRACWVNALMGGSRRAPEIEGKRIPIDMAFAFHSDAGVRDGDEIVGTLGIFYTRENQGRFEGGADRYRSRDLTDIVQTQIVEDIRRAYEPDWMRRGLWNRAYYEARIPSAPTMLLELLSHQNFADMRYGHDPRFKFFVSRAVYKGILRFLSSQYQTEYVVQPLPVEAFSTELTSDNGVRLSWAPVLDSLEATAAPDAYIVYTRKGEGGFDNGQRVDATSLVVNQEPGVVYSYKVTAVNRGGESFPSETLAAYIAPQSRGEVLIINGFDRISAPYSARCDSLAGFHRGGDEGVPDRYDINFVGEQCIFDLSMARCENDSKALGACHTDRETDVIAGNSFDYPALHGESLRKLGYSFVSTSRKALEEGTASIADYKIVDLILGKQLSHLAGRGLKGYEFKTIPEEMQGQLRRYVANGGALFVSGCYLAKDLFEAPEATDADRAFAEEVLHIRFDQTYQPHSNRLRVTSNLRAFSRGDYHFNTDATREHYGVRNPDAIRPAGDASVVLRYSDSGLAAGVASTEGGRSFVLAVPFESIADGVERDRLMRDVMRLLDPEKK